MHHPPRPVRTATASCLRNRTLIALWVSSCLGTSALVGSTGIVRNVSTLTERGGEGEQQLVDYKRIREGSITKRDINGHRPHHQRRRQQIGRIQAPRHGGRPMHATHDGMLPLTCVENNIAVTRVADDEGHKVCLGCLKLCQFEKDRASVRVVIPQEALEIFQAACQGRCIWL